jgi:Arc/MetJ-type ribon-helix-helix transcriptional regulator
VSSINIRIPGERKKQIKRTVERENYSSPSEWVREAIREKLERDTALYPEEVSRILDIWEQEDRADLDLTPADEVWTALGV